MRLHPILLLLLILMPSGVIFAQKVNFRPVGNVYFDVDKHFLLPETKKTLDSLADYFRPHTNYKIWLAGHTDSDADSAYNIRLSQRRVLAVKEYLVGRGLKAENISTAYFGEKRLAVVEAGDADKARNRRVEIITNLPQQEIARDTIVLAPAEPTIWDLYAEIKREQAQRFCIYPQSDTAIVCKGGTIVVIPANTIRTPYACRYECVTVEINEYLDPSSMILGNMSTMSDGEILETQGMWDIRVSDCTGKPLGLEPGKKFTVFMPTRIDEPTLNTYVGTMQGRDSNVNWVEEPGDNIETILKYQFLYCKNTVDGDGGCCPALAGMQTINYRLSNPPYSETDNYVIPASAQFMRKEDREMCSDIKVVMARYNVQNYEALLLAMNSEEMAKYNVSTLEDLAKAKWKEQEELEQKRQAQAKEDFLAGNLNTDAPPRYNVFDVGVGLGNLDHPFDIMLRLNVQVDIRVMVKTDLDTSDKVDCKLVLKGQRVILPAERKNSRMVISEVPRNVPAYLVALRYEKGEILLAMKEIETSSKVQELEFKKVSKEELLAKLAVLNL